MTVSDEQSSPEAQEAIRVARLVVPTFEESPVVCQHDVDPIEVGRGFEDDQHAFTVHRCPQCGTEFVTKEQE